MNWVDCDADDSPFGTALAARAGWTMSTWPNRGPPAALPGAYY